MQHHVVRNVTLALVLTFSACSKVPLTGRRQVNLLPESELNAMSLTSYREFLGKNPAESESDPNTQMVKRVGVNIQHAVERFLRDNKLSSRIEGYKWEFNLVNNKEVNAWCMPGGKVVVYSGLLAVTQNETALAVVMGHEIAHAIARHGNERMSQGLAVQAGGQALSVLLAQKAPLTQSIFLQSYGLGSQLGVLKYSRTHESEADKMGVVFMAMAGYDPQESIPFWQRMAKAGGGSKPPEILSTHPSDETRIADLKKFMPEALKYYKK
jgi:predicted Zn-dependent protease